MPDLALSTLDVTVDLQRVVFGPGDALGTSGWEAFLVNPDGSLIDTVDVVTWGDLTERMTEPATITLGVRAADVVDLPLIECEVQIYRDGQLMFWGLPVNRKAVMGSPIVEVDFADLSWWLTHRLCAGDPLTGEMIRNGGFESGLVRWSSPGATVDTTTHYGGAQSAQTTGTAGHVSQKLVIDQAMTVAVTAQVKVASAGYSGVGAESGLRVYASPWSGVAGRDVIATDFITSPTLGAWVTLAATVTIPTDGPYDLWVTIKGVDGTMNIDAVSAVPYRRALRTEAAGIFPPEETPTIDTGRLAREILSGAVGDLFSIAGVDSGAKIPDEAGQWDDKYAWEAMDVLRRLAVPVDWELIVTPTTRLIQVWAPATGRGDNHALTLTAATVVDAQSTEDGSQARTHARVLSDGGFRVDVDAGGWGGLRLDEVVQAPSGTPASELDGVGASHLGSSLGRVLTLQATTHEGASELIATLRVADIFLVDADVGGLGGAGAVRCVARTITPRTDTMKLTLEYTS